MFYAAGAGSRTPAIASLFQWVIYRHPADYPASYVVRRWRIGAGEPEVGERVTHRFESPHPHGAATLVFAQTLPWSVSASIDEARATIPQGLARLMRYDEDDAVIVEVWL